MVNPTEDGKDEASIKHVSSLRSLFENKSSVESGPSTSSSRFPSKSAKIDDSQNETHKGIRASFDILRNPSTLSTAGSTPSPQDLGNARISLPHSGQHSSGTLRRPVSPALLSARGFSPLVTADFPTSPSEESQTAKSFLHFSGDTQPPWPATVPPKRLRQHMMGTSSHLSKAAIENGNTGSKPVPKLIGDSAVDISKRKFPPPVNRADKPKISTKPLVVTGKVSLEPLITTGNESVSPFNAPPSSDEGVVPMLDKLGGNRLSQLNGIDALGKRGVAPQSTFHSLDRPQHASHQISALKLQGSDARRFGFTQSSITYQSMAEDPPELPPRKMQEQQSFDALRVQTNPATQFAANSVSPRTFLPPPKRVLTPTPSQLTQAERSHSPRAMDNERKEISFPNPSERQEPELTSYVPMTSDYPEVTSSNRRHPYLKSSVREIDTNFDTRLIDTCAHYVCATGHLTRIWDSTTGKLVLGLNYGEKEARVTALAFKPGANVHEEGLRLWLGTNNGDIQEIDIASQSIVDTKSGVHERREIIKIYRHQSSMWTLDDGGKLCVWLADDTGLPDLQRNPFSRKVHKGHTFSIVIQDTLWMATGKEIWIFRPNVGGNEAFSLIQDPLTQPGVGIVTSGAVVGGQLDRVYFGHADGKVTIYSTAEFACLGIVNVSVYKINSLAGAGSYLWAGYNTGMLYVYDTRTQPWTTKKDWSAHVGPIIHISVDRNSLWRDGVLRVVSLGADNTIKFWDGTLEEDWLNVAMQSHDVEYCSFREVTAFVVTWNAGASTPAHFRFEENELHFFQEMLQAAEPPDLLVFGFQELVDLEDKKLTAKTLFKANRKKDPSEQEHMSRQYRAWRDYLIRCVEDSVPSNEPYHLLHTASLVGLFSCVFIKSSQRQQIRNINAGEIKRGMGGLHGNKGALVIRFMFDDSSLCLVNCHLAAGQTQTVHRNNDLTAILESTILPPFHDSIHRETLAGGGDGSKILDNEICILNGDLNYRIDTMGRDTVVKAVSAQNFAKLLERDQLLVSRRRNPAFRVRAFEEFPITFAPTYKYDIGSDRYDTSEKHRAPAWCDRILYRGVGKIRQLDYRRHELRISDHRPVSGRFKIRIKTISAEKRAEVWRKSKVKFGKVKENLAKETKVIYLRDVLGVPLAEAMQLVEN